jgi:hypothetical protein
VQFFLFLVVFFDFFRRGLKSKRKEVCDASGALTQGIQVSARIFQPSILELIAPIRELASDLVDADAERFKDRRRLLEPFADDLRHAADRNACAIVEFIERPHHRLDG